MNVVVVLTNRQRRHFTFDDANANFSVLVEKVSIEEEMDGKRFYFAGKEILHENYTFEKLKIPSGALLRVEEAETPTHDRSVNPPISSYLEEDEDAEISRVMGFNSFSSTKGKNHKASDVSGVYINSRKIATSRQYMKRKGGTNRLLEAVKATKRAKKLQI